MADKKKREYTGMALEMDVIKKITHQLERLPRGSDAYVRIIEFVQRASHEHQLAAAFGPMPTPANGESRQQDLGI